MASILYALTALTEKAHQSTCGSFRIHAKCSVYLNVLNGSDAYLEVFWDTFYGLAF